ncbi:MAG: transglutaminase family protein [Ectothiorhodospiraceae bacterium]|nr:transglutaminase family protein [Ectothiorhodospiraceae bacterium]
MTIRVAVRHRTEYRYDRLVTLSPHLVRLRPAPHTRTAVHAYSLRVEPSEHFVNWQQDPFGNHVARFVFPQRTRSLVIEVDLVVDMTVVNPFDFFVERYAERWPFAYEPRLARDLAPYLEVTERGPRLTAWLSGIDRSEQPVVPFLIAVNQRVQRDVAYVVRMEPGVQTCEETLERGIGSCRDSGWLLVQALRHLGLAARFVSGYLVQLAPDIEALDGPSGPAHDFTDLHAWAEVFVPGAGWIGLDATSGLLAGEGHVPLACCPDPESAAPVVGAHDPAEVEFGYDNGVERIHEDPRVTRPYSEAQWSAIDALGKQVDRDLRRGDVRLTMGGEPTFVSIDDMDGAQWNSAALGPDKRRLAGELLGRLARRAGRGALRMQSQGKWYPGEPLPRWALSCFWRTDRLALWRDPARLLADDARPGHGIDEARALAAALAARLGLPADLVVPGYEDALHYVAREASLPENVDPLSADLDDPLERRRLAQLLAGDLRAPVGFALPVRHAPGDERPGRWRSSRWRFRRGHMFLLPGDSAMGLRMPLDSLPWQPPEAVEPDHPRDPFDDSPALGTPPSSGEWEETAEIIHTALCVESRDGRLHVFLPPTSRLEHFVALIAAVEDAVAECGVAVVVEGYEPPTDPRLRKLAITPDPGVIEVNVPPAASWRELARTTTALYEQARLTRLGTEKFMLDGRHTGTGGGNHVTLGGATPADSPLLRRPDLLRSLITYWQHHPSLSYLFSGSFIGPTSQAPRVDEARDDNLHELEIAFEQLPRGDAASPWVVDRALRNFLVDLTGNTHRAEFCIDKLYSPDGPTGRLGLLELRAFEMPPHARMSLVQMLLLRALVARFWRAAYRQPLVRWGTALHDRYMLPYFVEADLADVLSDLRAAGYPFDEAWLAPFVEFRFPVIGVITGRDFELELRGALEPWHVLGEEISAGGTARYVDSSVERLQVRVRGLARERHCVTCNGRRVPLTATDVRGEAVAGVRYKAWQPHSALHPSIGVHTPLVFDVVDIAAGRSVGGCTYHVAHPAGRNFETFPVNAFEAEARRAARFWSHGHTPGPVRVPPGEENVDHPYTLDLRRAGPDVVGNGDARRAPARERGR